MAFDNSLPRDYPHAAQSRDTAETGENVWAPTRATGNVEDKSFERSSRTPFIPHSVTLWDEIAPAPCAQPGVPDDEPQR